MQKIELTTKDGSLDYENMDENQSTNTAESIRQLNHELDRAKQERDSFQQEMFESDRYAAWLSHERQKLIDQINILRTSVVESSPKESLEEYIIYLEEKMWQMETSRSDLETKYKLVISNNT